MNLLRTPCIQGAWRLRIKFSLLTDQSFSYILRVCLFSILVIPTHLYLFINISCSFLSLPHTRAYLADISLNIMLITNCAVPQLSGNYLFKEKATRNQEISLFFTLSRVRVFRNLKNKLRKSYFRLIIQFSHIAAHTTCSSFLVISREKNVSNHSYILRSCFLFMKFKLFFFPTLWVNYIRFLDSALLVIVT